MQDITYKEQLEYLEEFQIATAREIVATNGNCDSCVDSSVMCPHCPVRIKCTNLELTNGNKVKYALEYLFSKGFTPADLLEDVF